MVYKEKRVAREDIFSGHVFDIYKDTVELENGKIVTREVVEHNGGVAVVAFAPSGGILMVRQYRYGADGEFLELPAGKMDKGEEPKTCGLRELTEETGYMAGSFEYLTEIFSTPAFCSERITIYVARDLKFLRQNLDENEFLTVEKVPFEKVVSMCLNGEINDAKTIVGILTYAMQQKGN